MQPTNLTEAGMRGDEPTALPGKHLPASTVLAINALAIAFLAALAVQVFHQCAHGAIAWMVGGRWEWVALFAVSITRPPQSGTWAELAIAGSPAILNILVGAAAVACFEIQWIHRRPGLRLLVYYLAAFSLFTGFSYLLFDPIVYHSGQNASDWQQVIDLLKGDWMIRAAISLIGAAGMLRSLTWFCLSTLRFSDPLSESPSRIPLAFPLLMIPYFGVNLIFSLLSLRHAAEAPAISSAVLNHWLNTLGLFWAFFLVAFWMRRIPSPADSTPVPPRILAIWCITASIGLAAAGLVLLPRFLVAWILSI